MELRKITSVLEHAFPAQPELAKEFTSKFFPHLSALSPHGAQQQQQQQQLMGVGGGVGSGSGFEFGVGGFGSGGSSLATTPSSAAGGGGGYGGPLTSPTSYLLFHQQQQQQQQMQQQSNANPVMLGGFPFTTAQGGGSVGLASTGAVKTQQQQQQPGHRRGNSRNGSTSSINFQSIYSQGMPGLGMIPPPTSSTQSSLASLASLGSLNGQHARKPSLTLISSGIGGGGGGGGIGAHKRQDSLNKSAIDDLRINPYFLTHNNTHTTTAANTATPGHSMSISPTSTTAPAASFPFQSIFPSATSSSSVSGLPAATLAAFSHHNRQPSTDF